MRFTSIQGIKEYNRSTGRHFFSKESMEFFDSRIESEVIGGDLFITSEQWHGPQGESEPRRFTVRQIVEGGQIRTIGEFQEHPDLSAAVVAAVRFASEREGSR